MRFVFVDEAGTSGAAHEIVRIVAAVILHADKQLLFAERALAEALAAVPKDFSENFIFHSEDIMGNSAYRDRWSLTDRLELLKSIMSIPRKLGAPICFSQTWASAPRVGHEKFEKLTLSQEHHFMTFAYCIAQADKWIRKHAEYDEIGMVVAEQSDLKRSLAGIPRSLRESPVVIAPGGLRMTAKERESGYCKQDGTIRVSRIRDSIHFVGKNEDRLVWIADACAYGLKRYFSKQQFGEEYCKAMSGGVLNLDDFSEAQSASTFFRAR